MSRNRVPSNQQHTIAHRPYAPYQSEMQSVAAAMLPGFRWLSGTQHHASAHRGHHGAFSRGMKRSGQVR